MTAVLEQIVVPERLTRPHPAVVAIRDDKEHRLLFKRDVRQRALRLLDAIAKDATSRGWAVACPAWRRHERRRQADLVITVVGHEHGVRVSEDNDQIPHEPTVKELRDAERWSYATIPKYDKVPSGRLTIAIDGGVPVRQSGFSDTKTLDVADRLHFILQEIELRAAASEERRVAAEQAAAARRHHWEQVRDEAITALREHNRADVLTDQARRWQEHQVVGEYLAAMRRRVAELEGEYRLAAQEWLDWASSHYEGSDPLAGRLALPPDPKADAEALKRFMRGLSPYGPEGGVRR